MDHPRPQGNDEDRLALCDVDNHHRPDMTEIWLDATTVLLRDNWRRIWVTGYTVDHWWLVVDGVPVAYLHTMIYTRDAYSFVLCDIEVREAHRGHGYARRIIAAADAATGLTLHTTGGFTPLGAAALTFVPLVPTGEAPGIRYQDMAFVADWDTLTPVSGL